ncbi:hypothetical protein P8C59_003824 [Phyllachora maydis]|uniref:Uncharacterized protein n=1 Tax=Phyllachora maydis TaxID=1825666 RepID=A0AAD9MAQ6_9PEZI|nr:hypothetical protein P8C59_003824 [Phyllachora maydis]
MDSSVPLQLAEMVQTAHIEPNPSLEHDLSPSTAASRRVPVMLEENSLDDSEGEDVEDTVDDDDEIPLSVLHHKPRPTQHMPLPLRDLRFEQSYLHSIAKADTWWMVAWITLRDQVMMPLVQGVIYNLAVCGWQFWNKNAQLSGSSMSLTEVANMPKEEQPCNSTFAPALSLSKHRSM